MRSLTYLIAVAALAVVVMVGASPGGAAFPGANGKIAFQRDLDIWVMNADGSGKTQLTTNIADDRTPKWSPDVLPRLLSSPGAMATTRST